MNDWGNHAPRAWRQPDTAAAPSKLGGVSVRAYEADEEQLLPGVLCVAFSHDGHWFATGGGPDNRVRLWDTATVSEVASWTTIPAVTALAFSPHTPLLAIASGYGLLHGVALGHTQATSTPLLEPLGDVNIDSLIWLGDRAHLAVAAWSGDVSIWNTANGTLRATLAVPLREWIRLDVTRDDPFLLTVTSDAAVLVWDTARNHLRHELALPPGDVVDVAYMAARNEVAVALYGAAGISLFRGSDMAPVGQLGTEPCTVTALAFDPQYTRLAAAHADGSVVVWDVGSRRCVRQWSLEATLLTALVWDPTASVLAVGDTHGRVWLLEASAATLA